MANFDRQRPLGEWNRSTPLTQAELEYMDALRPAVLNGLAGSVHAPSSPIIVGGSGLQGGLHTPTIITLASSPTLVLPDWAQLVWGWLIAGGGSGGAGEDDHGAGGGGTGRAVPFLVRVADLITKELVFTIGDGSDSASRGGTTTLAVDGIVLVFAEGGVPGQDSDPPAGLNGKGGNGSFGGGGGAPPNTIGGTAGGTNRTGWASAKLGYGQGGNADAYDNGGEGWGRGLDLDASDFSYAAPPLTPCPQRSNAGIGGTPSSGFNGGGGAGAPGFFDSSVAAEDGDPGGTADPGVDGSGKGGRGYGAGAGGSNGIAGYAASTRAKGAPGCAFVMMA